MAVSLLGGGRNVMSHRLRASRLCGLIKACGGLSMAVGLTYVLNLPRLTADATSATLPWGYVTLTLGIIVLLWTRLGGHLSRRLWRLLVLITLGITLLLQLPPALLWFQFSGEIIGDHPFGGPVGHWLWSVPHILLALAAMCAICVLLVGGMPNRGASERA